MLIESPLAASENKGNHGNPLADHGKVLMHLLGEEITSIHSAALVSGKTKR